MSAWVIALALSAGYLINKNLQVKSQLEQASTKFHSQDAEPAEPGPTSQEIRSKQQDPNITGSRSGGKYDDFYQGVGSSKQHMQQVVTAQDSQQAAVQEFESRYALPEIEGVMMLRDNFGI
jgi:hypothetical protein